MSSPNTPEDCLANNTVSAANITVTVANGTVFADTLSLLLPQPDTVWIEAYTKDAVLAAEVTAIGAMTGKADTTGDSLAVSFFTGSSDSGFGKMYRNWGQFIYNAAEGRFAYPISEHLLKLPENEGAQIDPRTTPFFPMSLDVMTKSYWAGGDDGVYIS